MDVRLQKLIEITDFETLFKKYGYSFFVNGDYNLNIIGVRNLIDGTAHKNTFNDALLLLYKVNGIWTEKLYRYTTDPGQSTLNAPSNSKGTAILVPGQYKGVYKIDLHNGKYKALCQRNGNVAVYRDNNKDDRLNFDPTTIEVGSFGINIHRAKDNAVTELINGYSAGCQVVKDSNDYNQFMQILESSEKKYGNKFTYTLVTSDMLTRCVYC